MINRIKLIFSLTLFLSSISFQTNAQYSQPLKDYVIEVWSAEEGLPSNNLRHVSKDKNGFLWISTFNGLVRFDGNKFKTYDTENVSVLSTSAFYSVMPSEDGKLYISTQSSGVIQLINGEFTKIKNSSTLPTSIQTTYLDPENRLWFGARNGGVYFLEDDKISRFSIPPFNDQSIMGFTNDVAGNLWIASEGAGIVRVVDGKVTVMTEAHGLVSNIVNSVYYHDGKIYAGTEKGLSVYENEEWVTYPRFENIIINYIAEDSNSNLWFAADIGLARLSHNNEFEFIDEANGLPSRQVSSVTFDDEDNIWLSTKQGGLVQLKLSNFRNITPANGLSYKVVNVIEEDNKGNLYIGSDNGDIDVIRDGKISKLNLKKDLTNVSVKDIYADDDGTLWIATYDGLIRKQGKSEKYIKVEDGLLSLKTRRILKDSEGIIWIASRNGGVNKILPNGNIESISVNEGLGSDFAFCVKETPDGRILVGTANGGLDIIHKDGHIDILKPDSTLTGLSIFNIYVENNNRFWMATNVGLYCYQNNIFTLINPSNGLAVETLFDIKEDKKGNLWATSILGLVRINKKEVLDFVNGKIDHVNTSILDNSDGMVTRECTGATRSLLAKNGKIWIPTIEGVTILDPENLVMNTKVPSVFIEDVTVDDKKIGINAYGINTNDNVLVINPGHRNYSISYTSLSMYSPEKVFFKYMLEGFDKDWIEIGPGRQAKYTNLPYGTYKFKVLAANNNGVWSTDYASIGLDIEPFFYERKLFIVGLILVFVVFTYLIYSFQTKEVNKRNKELVKLNGELDSFAYSVSHDLKAPLTSIQGLLNIARLEEGKDALSYYNRIETSVDKLDSFIKDIIDYSKNSRMQLKLETVHVRNLIAGMVKGLEYMNNEKEIRCTIDVDNDLEIVTDRTRITFIINNLLTNACRYADSEKEEPYVTISGTSKEGYFYLKVDDNGQGIKKEYQDKVFDMFYRANENSSGSGLGLYIVKESLDKLKGTVKLESELGVGTSINIKIPI
jgi:signal transduction histidine kinase/ligand-binding sensor domain-containing protein